MPKVNKTEDCCDNQLPHTLKYCVNKLGSDLITKTNDITYEGDISDLGNEVGYVLGNMLDNMSETQIRDFIFGLKHGISLTNGTH